MLSLHELASLDAAQLYILPIASMPAPQASIRLGGSAIGYAGARLIVREVGGVRLFDQLYLGDALFEAIAALPDVLKKQADAALAGLQTNRKMLTFKPGELLAFTRPRLFGVLNVTPDSFSDGGDFINADRAIEQGLQMAAQGADIIDVGGESTRPGAQAVWEGEELDRVAPVIKGLATEGVLVSIDTRHASVMKGAVEAGASIINDITGLTYDPTARQTAVNADVPVVLMHMRGTPQTMQQHADYSDTLLDVYDELQSRRDEAIAANQEPDRIILDPGIGFAKQVLKDNLALLANISLFHTLGCPLLVGASRKRFIGAITGVEEAKDRLPGSLAVAAQMVREGVQILRVHDCVETRQAVQMVEALLDAGAMEAATALDLSDH